MGKTVETIVGDAHGRYWEAASRGNIFTAANSANQATTAGNGVATGTGLLLSNPPGSGKVLSLLDISVGVGAVVAAVFEVGLFAPISPLSATALVHTAAITPRPTLIGAAPTSVALVDSSWTTPVTTAVHVRTLLASGWVTATAQSQEVVRDEVAGQYVIPPNAYIFIASVLGTQGIIASMTWEELPLAALG